jgi:hypothetical protein
MLNGPSMVHALPLAIAPFGSDGQRLDRSSYKTTEYTFSGIFSP